MESTHYQFYNCRSHPKTGFAIFSTLVLLCFFSLGSLSSSFFSMSKAVSDSFWCTSFILTSALSSTLLSLLLFLLLGWPLLTRSSGLATLDSSLDLLSLTRFTGVTGGFLSYKSLFPKVVTCFSLTAELMLLPAGVSSVVYERWAS